VVLRIVLRFLVDVVYYLNLGQVVVFVICIVDTVVFCFPHLLWWQG
jgi:hypothetical protein